MNDYTKWHQSQPDIGLDEAIESISQKVAETGKQLGIGLTAGMAVGAELGVLRTTNNNWRKMHGLPLYHRNRPSLWMARKSKLRRWETEHEGVET